MQDIIIVGITGGCLIGITIASRQASISITCWVGLLTCMFLLHGCKAAASEPTPKIESIKSRLWVYQDFGDPFPAYFIVDVKECVEYLSLPPAPPIRTRVSKARPCDLIPYRK